MPFVPHDIERREPPNKRRKLFTHSTMARREEDGSTETFWHVDSHAPHRADEGAEQADSVRKEPRIRTSSREELIECIKKGQKPTWIPTPGFQALCDQEEALAAQRNSLLGQTSASHAVNHTVAGEATKSSSLQSATTRLGKAQKEPFERPRSALHRGDFSEHDFNPHDEDFWVGSDPQPGLAISTIDSVDYSSPQWYSDSPRPTSFAPAFYPRATLSHINTSLTGRRRAPSLGSSLSSSFVMRAPTSPLVHATSNPDLEPSTVNAEAEHPRLQRDSMRRRTMPPNSFHSFTMTPIDTTPPNFSRPLAPALRREISLPSHTHRSQRSLTSFTYHPKSNPQTPLLRSRRPSVTSETVSRRRTSMVGSFEESILRGRMSTPPSKPLDFVAQIGVMGKGECPASLKCPAHVSVSFPAVFYSYPASTGIRSVADDTPSPYVGTIDLDHNLKPVILASKKSKKDVPGKEAPMNHTNDVIEQNLSDAKLCVGGAYRVPQEGQLQIVIKNPNKTAVKLYLVPYSLQGMEAGTKTFVRQRSFSTGSIIDNALSAGNSVIPISDPLENKHILRYLIHLKFCCPAKNRFYLYDDIRVVFANRVPDGKEKLRNDLQLPDPKYSTWKPSRPEGPTKPSQSAPSTPIVKSFDFETPQFFGDMDGFQSRDPPISPTPIERAPGYTPTFEFPKIRSRPSSPIWEMKRPEPDLKQAAAFEFPDVKTTSVVMGGPDRALSPITGFTPTTPLRGSPIPWRSPSTGDRSNRSFSPVPELRDSLLSRQLKELNELNLTKEPSAERSGVDDEMADRR